MSSVLDLVAKITLDTTEYDKGLDSSKSKAGSFGDKVKKGLTAVGAFAVKGLGVATAAAGAFGLASVKTGMTFDKAMSQVGATMGKTSEQMEKEVGSVDLAWGKFSGNLREYAQEMGAHTSFSATQAAEALNYMALAGYDTQTSMQMLPNVLNLAAAGAMNLGSASDMVTDAQTALGLSTEETTVMVDQMAKTSSTTNTSVSQLGDAILTIGATARSIKGGTLELSQVLGVLADNGIKGAEGGTHLRNMILSLQNPTKDAEIALEELGVSVYDANHELRSMPDIFSDLQSALADCNQESKDASLSSIFNKTDLAAANALIGTSSERWDEVAAAIGDSAGAAQQMADIQLDNLSGDITLFKSALEGAQIAISDGLSPVFRGFVQEGSDGLTRFTEAVKSGDLSGAIAGLGTTISNLAVKAVEQVPSMVSAGGQLLLGIGKGILQNAPTLINTAGQLVMPLYKGVMSNAPKLIQTAAGMVDKLGEGLVSSIPRFLEKAMPMLESFTGMLRENSGVLINAGLNLILNIAQGIVNAIPTLVQCIPLIVINIAGVINDNAPKILATGVQIVGKLVKGIINALPVIAKNIPKILQAIVSVFMAFNWVQLGINLLNSIVDGVASIATKLPEAIRNIGQTAFDWLSTINWATLGADIIDLIVIGVQSLVSLIPTTLKTIGTTAIELFKSIDWLGLGTFVVESIVSTLTALPSAIQVIFNAVSNVVKSIVSGAIGIVKAIISSGFEACKKTIINIWNVITTFLSTTLGKIRTTVSTTWENIKSTVGGAVENIKTKISNGFTEAKEKAASTFSDMKDAIKEKLEAAKSTVKGIIEKIKGFFPIKIGKWLSDLPKISLKTTEKTVLGKTVTIPTGFEWHAKAMQQPYMFREPTLFGAGEAGDEFLYGHRNLMRDIKQAVREAGGGGFVQNITINSPTQLTPSEIARQTRNQTRNMVMRMRTA